MKRTLCLALALCLLLSGLPAALSEALDGELTVAADAEDDWSIGEAEGDLFDAPIEDEAPADGDASPEDAAVASYARLLRDAPLSASADGSGLLATLPEGSRVLVVEPSNGATLAACATEGGLLVGYIPAEFLDPLNADEVAAMQAELFAGRVVLYEDDINRPLPWAQPLDEAETDSPSTEEADAVVIDEPDEAPEAGAPTADAIEANDADPDEADAELPEVRETPAPAESDATGTENESIEPVEEECEPLDSALTSDELFAGYVNRFFYNTNTSVRRLKTKATANAGSQLTGIDKQIYDILYPEIIAIAAGDRSVTKFDIPVSTLLGQTRFTAADLGVEIVLDEDGALTEASATAMQTALNNRYKYNKGLIRDALWLDCTYEFYWLDRYDVQVSSSYFPPPSPVLDGDEYAITLTDKTLIRFNFPVLEQYQLNGNEYAVDTSLIKSAQTAAENAKAIVNKYANYSDYAKLYGYAVEICDLVSYNSAALKKDWPDAQQDPWKLIWVFDGDPDTNVVCEGYSQAFQYLCELSSFEGNVRCYMVTGTATEAHSWNLVRIDGQGYVVDTTWMDGAWDGVSGSMADWISDEVGKLFLCGGSGSVAKGYTVAYRGVSGSSFRTYRESDTLNLYPESALTLAGSKYILTGWQAIGGDTYYFDDGRYLTGAQEIDGKGYRFSDSGKLLSGVLTGWQTVGNSEMFFEEDGTLHVNHTAESIAAVAATCTTDGLTEGSRCTVCGEVLTEQEPIPAGHTPVSDAAVAASCTTDGLTEGSHCAVCGKVITAQEFVPAGHTPISDAAVAASCTTDGLTEGSHCAVCGEVITAQEFVPATGHSPVTDASVEPSCTTDGLTEGSHCSVCGEVLTEQEPIPATGHRWGDATYTWAADNSSVTARRVCANDASHVETETVKTTSAVALAPTCTAKGKTTYTATFANAAFAAQNKTVEDIPAKGHTAVTDAAVAATCTAAGKTEGSHCSVCGAVLTAQTAVAAKGHNWGDVTYTWAADNSSVTAKRVCANDASHVETETVKTAASVALAPTCTAKGKTTYTAKFANAAFAAQSKTVDDIPAKGHTVVVDKAVAATYTATGLTEGSHCSVCGAVLKVQEVTAKLNCDFHMKKSASKTVNLGVPIQIIVDGKAVKSYKSSNKKVVTVTSKGWVATKKAGTAKITITLKNKKKLTLTVKVVDPYAPKSVKITMGKKATLKKGKTLALATTLTPTTARTTLTWSSSNKKVATVSSKGVVTAKKKGTAKITVKTANGKKATITITVK